MKQVSHLVENKDFPRCNTRGCCSTPYRIVDLVFFEQCFDFFYPAEMPRHNNKQKILTQLVNDGDDQLFVTLMTAGSGYYFFPVGFDS